MIKAMIELMVWLKRHDFDSSGVTVTVEFGGPEAAARASRHLLHDCGQEGSALGLTYPKAVARICGIDFKIVGRT